MWATGRLMIVVLIAVLAVGTVARAASATVMTLHMASADEMATAVDPSMHMDDCIGCGAGDMLPDSAACDMVCTAPFVAVIPDGIRLVPPAAGEGPPPSGVAFAGRTAPPDPLPPRANFLR
jgi:hypothetical protein